jgi:hypothetical protein
MRVDWVGAALGAGSVLVAVLIGLGEASASWAPLAIVLSVLTVAQLTS